MVLDGIAISQMGIGAGEVFVILIFVLLIVGPDRLPKVGKTVGKAINQYKKAENKLNDDLAAEGITTKDVKEAVNNPFLAMEKHEKAREEKVAAEKAQEEAAKAAEASRVGAGAVASAGAVAAKPVQKVKFTSHSKKDGDPAEDTPAGDAEEAPASTGDEDAGSGDSVADAQSSASDGTSSDAVRDSDAEEEAADEAAPAQLEASPYPEVEAPAPRDLDVQHDRGETFAERKQRLEAERREQSRVADSGDDGVQEAGAAEVPSQDARPAGDAGDQEAAAGATDGSEAAAGAVGSDESVGGDAEGPEGGEGAGA